MCNNFNCSLRNIFGSSCHRNCDYDRNRHDERRDDRRDDRREDRRDRREHDNY